MTDYPAILPQHVDSTMIACARQCLQKFFDEFVIGLRSPVKSVDLHAGGCFATALEAVYRNVHQHKLSPADAYAKAYATFTTAWGDFTPLKDTAKTQDRMWATVLSYFETYPPLEDHVQPYIKANGEPAIEFTFSIPLTRDVTGIDFPVHPVSGEPFVYVGRFDMLGRYHDIPCIRDEKTTGRGFAFNWSETWDLRSQFIGYKWACNVQGIPVEKVIVRGVAILKTKIDHAEAIKDYSNELTQRWLFQVSRDLHRIVKAWNDKYWDYNFADACTQYGLCSYTNLCTSPVPENWYSQFAVRRWNPLDKGATSD